MELLLLLLLLRMRMVARKALLFTDLCRAVDPTSSSGDGSMSLLLTTTGDLLLNCLLLKSTLCNSSVVCDDLMLQVALGKE